MAGNKTAPGLPPSSQKDIGEDGPACVPKDIRSSRADRRHALADLNALDDLSEQQRNRRPSYVKGPKEAFRGEEDDGFAWEWTSRRDCLSVDVPYCSFGKFKGEKLDL